MRVAYMCEPHMGGMFSFFLKLRPALADRGIDFRCVCPFTARLYRGSQFEGIDGVDYIDLDDNPAIATGQMIAHLESHQYHIVMVLPGCYEITTNLPRYLPGRFRCAARLPHNARGVYLPTKFIADYLDRIVTVSDRLQEDLVQQYGIDPQKIDRIYNGIEVEPEGVFLDRLEGDPCRLLFVGRIEDLQKNVFLLPEMMKEAVKRHPALHLTVVGDGPDLHSLKTRFHKAGLASHSTVLGPAGAGEVETRMKESHVFVLPSRFEGSPNALLEAMRTGCVPVVSRIRGITDVFVEDGVSGAICRMGDAADFAEAVVRLAEDESLRATMGRAAHQRMKERFSLDRMVAAYEKLFLELKDGPGSRKVPLSLDAYEMPDVFGPTWRRFIPRFIKKMVRTKMERMGKSV